MFIIYIIDGQMLKHTNLKNLKAEAERYKVSVGDGLVLIVSPNGRKHWRMRYEFAGREKSLSLGRFPQIGLLEARSECERTKAQIRSGVDPSLERKLKKHALARKHGDTFSSIAFEWHSANACKWVPNYAEKLLRIFQNHLFPYIGKVPVADLKPRDILSVLRRMEQAGVTDISHRALWLCQRVFRYGIAIGVCELNPAADIGDGLVTHRTKGLPVIDLAEIPKFLKKLNKTDARPADRLALRLLLLTALRTGELRRCRWSDVDIALAQIRVPAEVMKMRDVHIVPLSHQAIDALRELWNLSGHQEWLFPNPGIERRKYPYISENVVNNLIHAMGYKGRMTGHSVRKLFSTVLNEQEFNPDAIERQLAHAERRKVRAAYNYAQHLNTRRFLMQWWADYLDSQAGIQLFNATKNIGFPPSGSPDSNLYRPRIFPGLNSPEPSALTYRNQF